MSYILFVVNPYKVLIVLWFEFKTYTSMKKNII